MDCGFWGDAEAKKKTLEFTTDDEVITTMLINVDDVDLDDESQIRSDVMRQFEALMQILSFQSLLAKKGQTHHSQLL